MKSTTQTGSANAWLVSYDSNSRVVLPYKACHEVLEAPEFFTMPKIVPHALGILKWHEQWIPLIDLQAYLTGVDQKVDEVKNCLIIAYKGIAGRVEFGAIAISDFPDAIFVTDNSICPFPQNGVPWKKIALSCVSVAGKSAPIIDSSKLFSKPEI